MTLLSIMALGGGMSSCNTSSASSAGPLIVREAPSHLLGGGVHNALPQARIYRTSTDVDALVPVTINPIDGSLVSYPAPTDITANSMPVALRDGWWLDRRGVGPDTRFINYTYSRYRDLSEAPSPAEILNAIMPDARVTEIVTLPFKVGAATPARVDSLISAGLPGCEITYKAK